jgi:hypothetical protein
METNEPNKIEGSVFFTNDELNSHLRETAKWGKLLAIVGFVGLGILVIIALVFISGLTNPLARNTGGLPQWMGIIYLAMGALYYFPTSYIYSFSKSIKNGLDSNDEETVLSGFSKLKSLFKFMGITTLVILSIYALIIVFAVLAMGMR